MSGLGDLDGKVAIITGAARGQGEAEARLFVSLGARVVLTDVLEEQGRQVEAELGDSARFRHHDVSVEGDWDDVITHTLESFGRVDVLVNNAAIHWTRPLVEERPAEYLRLLSVNLVGALLGMQAVVEPMSDHGHGSIINVSSVAATAGMVGLAAYGSAKWGLRGLSKTAAVELGPMGIRVNTILPGPIATSMMHREPDGNLDRFQALPLRRHGEPEEVAPLVAFLASDSSAFLTGAEVTVDGGFSALAGGAA